MKITNSEITVRNGGKVLSEVLAGIRKGDTELDFHAVKKIDSTALAVILAAKRALPKGQTLAISNEPAQLSSLVAAYGVQSLFD